MEVMHNECEHLPSTSLPQSNINSTSRGVWKGRRTTNGARGRGRTSASVSETVGGKTETQTVAGLKSYGPIKKERKYSVKTGQLNSAQLKIDTQGPKNSDLKSLILMLAAFFPPGNKNVNNS